MEKRELQENGFVVVERWHLIAAFVIMVLSLGVTIGATKAALEGQLTDHEKRIVILEDAKEKHIASEMKLNEISFNLRNICKRLNLEYIEEGIK